MSYVNPQIDHNLYNSIMPQLPVDLMARVGQYRQQMYNAGVAQVQRKVGSMLNMENNVSSELVKGVVNRYNKDANELIKQYSTLDFSQQDNVNLVNNVYDPLMNDEAFMIDYSTTLNKNSQIQKALAMRDSSNKDVRNQFSMTNLRAMTNKYDDLGSATSFEELKKGAAKARGAYYTPYEDYKKTIRELTVDNKDFFMTETTTPDGKGRLITYKGVPYKSMSAFLQANLTDKELGQMKIESDVAFYDQWKASGLPKGEYLGRIQDGAILGVEEQISSFDKQLAGLKTKLASYGPDNKLSKERKAEKDALLANQSNFVNKRQQMNGVLSDYTDNREKFQNGELSEDVLYNSLENITSHASMGKTIDRMARGLSEFRSGPKYSNDEAHWKDIESKRLQKAYELSVKKQSFDEDRAVIEDEQWLVEQRVKAAKEGFVLDANGRPIDLASQDAAAEYVAKPEGKAVENLLGDVDHINTKRKEIEDINIEQVKNETTDLLIQYAIDEFDFVGVDDNEKKELSSAIMNLKSSAGDFTLSEMSELLKTYGFPNKTTEGIKKLLASLTSEGGFRGDEEWGDVIDEIRSFASSSTKSSKTLHNIYMRGKTNRMGNAMEAKMHATMTDDAIAAYNADQTEVDALIQRNPQTGNIEAVDTRVGIQKHQSPLYNLPDGRNVMEKRNTFVNGQRIHKFYDQYGKEVDKSELRWLTKNVFTNISYSSKGQPAEKTLEDFNEFLNTQKGIDGSFQSILGKGISNDAAATRVVSSASNNQLYQNYNEDFFTTSDINNSSIDNISRLGNKRHTKFVNDLVRKALRQVASNQQINGKYKNLEYSVSKFEDFGAIQNIKFNRTFLEQMAGVTNFDGSDKANYEGDYKKSEVNRMIGFIMDNNVNVKTGKEEQKFNTTRAYLSRGYTVPISSDIGDVSINMSLKKQNGSQSYQLNFKLPEGGIQPEENISYFYDIKNKTFTIDQNVRQPKTRTIEEGQMDINKVINNANTIGEVNEYIKTPEFFDILKRDIDAGNIELATNKDNGVYLLPSNYIMSSYVNNYRK